MLSSLASCCASKGLQAKKRPPTSSVGTVRLPLLALMTISSPDGSFSISTSRKSRPRSFKKDFARRQSGHQVVLYMVIGSIFYKYSIRLDAGGGANAHEVPCDNRQGSVSSCETGLGDGCFYARSAANSPG